MDKDSTMYDFFMSRKSTKASVEGFMNKFFAEYQDYKTKEQRLLSQCFQQMFRKYYYSELLPDTYITPANIINTLVKREFGNNVMALPLLEVKRKNKKIENIECTVISFEAEDHFFIEDMLCFLMFAQKGIPMSDEGIIPDESRGNLGDTITIDDRHYINIISMLAKYMGLLERTSSRSSFWRTSTKAKDFLKLGDRDKLKTVISFAVQFCSEMLTQGLPQLKMEFSPDKIENILKKPKSLNDILNRAFNKLGIDLAKLSGQVYEKSSNNKELSEDEFDKMMTVIGIQGLVDMYFTVPFGYYMQIIQPIYPEMYDFEFEIDNILQHIDNPQAARVGLFSTAHSYDLTVLGEEMLLGGKRSKRNHEIPDELDDEELYNAITEIDDEDYEEFDHEVINISDYLDKSQGSKSGKVKRKEFNENDRPNSECDKRVFVLKVKMFYKKRTWREVEIKGNQALDELSKWIVDYFELDDGHLYSFFMSNKAWDSSSEYSHPQGNGRSASKAKISGLNLSLKQKFLYIYDYGDEHTFEIELVDIRDVQDGVNYPRLTRKNKSPVIQCGECKSSDKPVEWFCCDHETYLCDKCKQSKKHEECYITKAIL